MHTGRGAKSVNVLPFLPFSLSLSISHPLLSLLSPLYLSLCLPQLVDVRLINEANCFMAGLAWCWQCNQAEWGGLGEVITLPIVRKDRRTWRGRITLGGTGPRREAPLAWCTAVASTTNTHSGRRQDIHTTSNKAVFFFINVVTTDITVLLQCYFFM